MSRSKAVFSARCAACVRGVGRLEQVSTHPASARLYSVGLERIRSCTRVAYGVIMFSGTTLCEVLEPRMLFAHPTFTVSFSDPNGANIAYYAPLRATLLAAGADWGQYFTSTARIDIEIDFTTDLIRATGSSTVQQLVRQAGSYSVYQAGAAAKLVTGVDVNGGSADIVISMGQNYLYNELWIDPDPTARTAEVPPDKTDAYSVLLHELGHALGFIGYRDGTTGTISGSAETTYDASTVLDKGTFYFTGPTAATWYGQNVPLTFGNIDHVGNDSPGPGTDLVGDLMNGVVFNRGTRYDISGTDLAILQDTGLASTLFPWANLSGIVFFDTNHNGVADRHEAGLAGWRVYADLNGNGLPDPFEPSAVTDATGHFTIAGLHPGRYVLRAYGKRHWTLTSPVAGYSVLRPTAGRTTAAPMFGLYNAGALPTAPASTGKRVTTNAVSLQVSTPIGTQDIVRPSLFANIPLPSAGWLCSGGKESDDILSSF